MTIKRLMRPRDPIALAKLIGDITTGQVADAAADKRDPAAVSMGQKGGKEGVNEGARCPSAPSGKVDLALPPICPSCRFRLFNGPSVSLSLCRKT